jgi:rRNA-processing protein FCF1
MKDKKPKTYVLDTTEVLYDSDIFYRLKGRIVVPTAVLKELDGLKRGEGNTALSARKVARTLDVLGGYGDCGAHGDLVSGVRVSTGGTVVVYPFFETIDDLDSEEDNRIVGAAIRLKRAGEDVVLLTLDTNMRTVARAYGIKVRPYPAHMGKVFGSPGETREGESNRTMLLSGGVTAEENIPALSGSQARNRSTARALGGGYAHKEPIGRFSLINLLRALLRRISRAFAKGNKGDPFFTMGADQHRLLTDYRESREALNGKASPRA